MRILNALLAVMMASLAVARAELIISEIDLANNKVEILNSGPGTENLTGYFLCNRLNGNPFYPQITTLLIDVPNSSTSTLTLAAGQWVTLQMTASFIPDGSGEVGLYVNGSFDSASSMRDYVGWGANGFRDDVAAAKGIWAAGTFVTVTGITAGQTIQLGAGLSGNQASHYSLAASTIGVNQVTPTPVVTTGSASSIASTSATLSGTANAKGVSTTVTFQYGETLSYGTTVAATPSPVSGSTDTAVSAALSGLTPGTSYNFRVVGTNANGTTLGANQTFTTPGPPSVVTGGASGVTNNAATLAGSVTANGADATVTFEYGETTAYGTTVSGSPGPVSGFASTPVSAAISGLTPGTTYHYRLVAGNTNGTTPGSDQTFTTAAPPLAVTGAASGVSSGTATVSGTVTANFSAATVTIEYGETTAYGSSVTASPSPVAGGTATTVSALLSGLAPTTTYHYRVVATNSYGTDTGDDATFTTTVVPVITTLTVTAVSRAGNSITVSFSGQPNIAPATWTVKGSSTLASFPDNKTADAVITETPLGSGNYQAVVDVTGEPATYFIRIERP